MSVPSGTATTFDLPNYVGPIFMTSISQTPFTSMLGGLRSFDLTQSPEFADHQFVTIDTVSQETAVEGDDPTASHQSRDDVVNVVEIKQKAVQIAYSKLAGIMQVTTDNADLRSDSYFLGDQPVKNEVDEQLDLKMIETKRELEFSAFQGTFQNPANNSSARQTRGINSHITTNSVSASSADLSRDHYQELLRTMADNGAIFQDLVAFQGSLQVQRTTDIYAYAPESRTIGGVAINRVLTDFGEFGVKWAPDNLNSVVTMAEVSVCRVVAMPIPQKGVLFVEPLARTGSSVKAQLYGEVGYRFGPETYSGEITSLTTS